MLPYVHRDRIRDGECLSVLPYGHRDRIRDGECLSVLPYVHRDRIRDGGVSFSVALRPQRPY